MSDGDAMLLAMVRRKGCAEALADWLWERLPPVWVGGPESVPMQFNPAACARSKGMVVALYWFARNESGVWVRLVFQFGSGANRRDWRELRFVPTDRFRSQPFGATLLAQHIREFFVRRKK